MIVLKYSDLNEQQKKYARDYAHQKLQALYDLYDFGEVKITDPEIISYAEDRKYTVTKDNLIIE